MGLQTLWAFWYSEFFSLNHITGLNHPNLCKIKFLSLIWIVSGKPPFLQITNYHFSIFANIKILSLIQTKVPKPSLFSITNQSFIFGIFKFLSLIRITVLNHPYFYKYFFPSIFANHKCFVIDSDHHPNHPYFCI